MAVKLRKRVKKKTKGRSAASAAPTKSEVTALGRAIRALGGAAGSAMGAYAGNPAAGGVLGTSLGAALSRWLGAGDYSVTSNSVVKQSMKAAASIPSMHNDQQSVVIRHKEYLCEVRGSAGFVVQQSFPINPGLAVTFPWLSNIAASFQEYRLRGVVFHYVPTSGASVASANTNLGSVMLQTSYRSNDAAPSSKVELLNEFWSNEVVPSDTMAHPLECDPKENPFNVQYIRTGAIPSGDSQLMYDLGVTHLAVSGCPGTGVLGDLWVTYEVELKKPLLFSNVTSRVESASQLFLGSAYALSPSVLFPAASTLTGSIPIAVTNSGGTQTITFPRGTVGSFLIYVQVGGGGLALTANSFAVTNATLIPVVNGNNNSPQTNLSGSSIVTYAWAVSITDPSVTAQTSFFSSGTASTISAVQVAVAQTA